MAAVPVPICYAELVIFLKLYISVENGCYVRIFFMARQSHQAALKACVAVSFFSRNIGQATPKSIYLYY